MLMLMMAMMVMQQRLRPVTHKLMMRILSMKWVQIILNGLATIALENDILVKIKYDDRKILFSRNTRRMLFW